MDDDLRIAETPTLRALAVDRLRQAIITGRFPGGQRLVERTLCDQLGVSRSVVREAIRYLEAEGLVDTSSRSGPIVARLDWPQAEQVYAIRRLLEAEAAAACARRATAETRAALAAALNDIEAAFADPAGTRLYEATTAFYRLIFAAAGHDIAWDIVQRLNGRISRLRALTLATTDRQTSGPAHMARIAHAIIAGDATAAAQAVRDHLDDAARLARALLEGGA
jgi:DNA-binding GntR family transcriptional regulator